MSPPNTPNTKITWINRQLNKLNNKLHKLHPGEGKKNKVEDTPAGEPTDNGAGGREVGFSAFGDDSGGVERKGKENVGVVEIPGPPAGVKPLEGEVPATDKPAEPAESVGAGSGSGTDAVDRARSHALVPFDGEVGKTGGGGGIQGDITANTALNSHPVAGLFRKD